MNEQPKMNTVKFKFHQWNYVLAQDPTTGDLSVASKSKIGLVDKAVQYLKAEASGLVGTVSLPVVEQRKAACFGCESLQRGLGADDGENLYCKSCGCPQWERSRLQVKWELPGATCPLGKWPAGQ